MKLQLDGTKIGYHHNRVNSWLIGAKITPITVDMALTTACNYKCVYCYGKLQENKQPKRENEWNNYARFLKDAKDIGVKAISLVSDGESTCSPYVYDFINLAKNLGLDIALGTNGLELEYINIQVLRALTYLRFNISAGEKERYKEIHGCKNSDYFTVIKNIRRIVSYKRSSNLKTTIGLQMVFMPEFKDQIKPLVKLGKDLGVDYLVIKHCSDNEVSDLKVSYCDYKSLDIIKELEWAEKQSTDTYQVIVKWSKINAGKERTYDHCYGPNFILQISGTGLVAPCGMLFNDKYKKYHIGNIHEQSFKEIVFSEKYDEVMRLLAEEHNVHTMCGTLCLQHNVNEYLDSLKKIAPEHINFI